MRAKTVDAARRPGTSRPPGAGRTRRSPPLAARVRRTYVRADCRVFLLRHGQTVLNVQGRFRGLEDPPLDPQGRREARKAAQRLAEWAPRAIYSSPLRRARQTAGAVAALAGRRVRVRAELADLDYGRWTGRTPAEVRSSDPDRFRRFRTDPESVRLPGGELVRAVRLRVERLLREAAERFPGHVVVAVTHDVPIRLVVAHARGLAGGAVWRGALPTGSVTALRVGPAGIRLDGQRERAAAGATERRRPARGPL